MYFPSMDSVMIKKKKKTCSQEGLNFKLINTDFWNVSEWGNGVTWISIVLIHLTASFLGTNTLIEYSRKASKLLTKA